MTETDTEYGQPADDDSHATAARPGDPGTVDRLDPPADQIPTAEQPRIVPCPYCGGEGYDRVYRDERGVSRHCGHPVADPAEHEPPYPSGSSQSAADRLSPQTEAGRSFRGACGYDHTDRILAIEREAAARREIGTARQKHAAWCWLPLAHQGQCEGDQ